MRRFARRVVLLCGVMALTAACAFGEVSPPQPQELEVGMRDHAYEIDGSLQPGRVVVTVTNRGEVDHDLILLEIPEGVADTDELLASSGGGLRPVYTMASRSPGETGVFAVDLAEGRYAMLCDEAGADGTPHHRKGMSAEFAAGDPDVDGASPSPGER